MILVDIFLCTFAVFLYVRSSCFVAQKKATASLAASLAESVPEARADRQRNSRGCFPQSKLELSLHLHLSAFLLLLSLESYRTIPVPLFSFSVSLPLSLLLPCFFPPHCPLVFSVCSLDRSVNLLTRLFVPRSKRSKMGC